MEREIILIYPKLVKNVQKYYVKQDQCYGLIANSRDRS